jgi:hypothetical protein
LRYAGMEEMWGEGFTSHPFREDDRGFAGHR